MLRRGRFLTGAYNDELEVKDVTWLDPAGSEMSQEQWGDGNAKCMAILLDGRAQPTGLRQRGADATLLMVMNAYHDVVNVTLPEVTGGSAWSLVLDTNIPDQQPGEDPDAGNEVWLGSADMMHRNLDRRVETLVRVSDPAHGTRLRELIDLGMDDGTSSWWLSGDGTWTRHARDESGAPLRDVHESLIMDKSRGRLPDA